MKKDKDMLSVVPESRTRPNGLKLYKERFWSYIRKNFLKVRVVQQRNRLPREVGDCPSLEVFKQMLNSHILEIL